MLEIIVRSKSTSRPVISLIEILQRKVIDKSCRISFGLFNQSSSVYTECLTETQYFLTQPWSQSSVG